MNTNSHAVQLLLASTAMAGFTSAQTIIVDTANDVVDFGGAQQIADLPGPDGRVSLPEAGLASDNTPGVQTIGFHIPQSEWEYQQFFPGRAVLRPFLGFRVFDTAILDARTQTAFTGETNPEGGGEVVIWQETYLIDNVGGAVFGFDNSSIHLSGGSNNVIQANTKTGVEVFDSAFNLIGGANPGQGNTGGFIQIDRASNNVVVGNTVQRVRVLGWIAGGQPAANNRIGGPSPGERNYITGLGTWNSQGWPSGFAVQLFNAIGTVIENNQIGTTPDGLQPGHQATTAGIYFDDENDSTTIRGNRIAGILGHRLGTYPGVVGTAIAIGGYGSGIEIVGNTIGLDAHGAPVLGSVTGIGTSNYYLGSVQNVVIGGSAAGAGNEIAGHLDTGISVASTFAGMRISGNSIHDNGGLGIDLITSGLQTGVTPNDTLDADTGGNGLQNFPVITSAAFQGAQLRVTGSLHSSALELFRVEFFVSPGCDASGFGEGQRFVGSTTLSTNASGDSAFDLLLSASIPANWVVTATATHEPSGETSEFSACLPITGAPGPSFCAGDGSGIACPCGNNGSAGNGCANSGFASGASLAAAGQTSVANDSVSLDAHDMTGSVAVFFQGATQAAATIIDDGIGCVGGPILRLGNKPVVSNASSFPQTGDPSISVRGAIPAAGGTYYYQCFYRNATAAFCPPATSNRTNGVVISWSP